MIDCIIVGSGPAGISAALTLKSNGKNFLFFGSPDLSEKIEKAESIRNYPGFLGLTGKAFAEDLKRQLQQNEIAIKEEKVAGVYALKEKFLVTTQEGNTYESRSVILACGVESVRQIEGEESFTGRGVSYCATCDGFLHRGKTIAVFCAAPRYEHEVTYLAGLAAKVYLYTPYKDCAVDASNVEKIAPIRAVTGTERVSGITLFDGTEIAVEALFCLRNAVAPTTLLPSLTVEGAHIVVDRAQRTNIPGCFAAGDCTGRPYQLAKAVGEGNVAAHSILEYLAEK